MSDKQWHVFYRTVGMAESKQGGFRRADFLAESAQEALDKLLGGKHNVLHARVYPGASAYTVEVGWANPDIIVKHAPHVEEEDDTDWFRP